MAKKTFKENIPVKKTSENKSIVLVFLIILSVIFVVICFNNEFIQDDAYISFRYIQNFVAGNGLVFNIGEKVEGYTNLLWVLILSLFGFFKINFEDLAQPLSVLFGILVLFMTYFISGLIVIKDNIKNSKKSKPEELPSNIKYFNLIPSVLLVFTGSFIFWSISGMESTMFISFCMLGIYFYIKDKDSTGINYKFPLFILLATLTRPEGLYFFGLILVHKFLIAVKENKALGVKEFFSKNNLISYLIYIVPIIFYFAIRYSYYGYLFPNTYYAKTGFSSVYLNSGIEYFTKFLTSYLLYGIILIAPLYLFKKKENFFACSLFYLIIVCFIIYVISVGGDVLKQNRFFLPVLPLIYILLVKFLTEIYLILKNIISQGLAFGMVLIISGVICIYYYSSQKENLERDIGTEKGLVYNMKIAGEWFKSKQQQLGRPLNLAATTIGAVSYFAGSNVNVIDMLGLTDKEIAHNPKLIPEISEGNYGWKERNYNADYVMSRDPDYIYFSTGLKPSAYGERALYTNEEFMKYYYPYYISNKSKNFTDAVYKRKTDDEVKDMKWNFPGNPNYKVTYVNMFNQALNTSRDKSKSQTAINEFKQSLEIGPESFGLPYQYMANIYQQQDQKDLAFENYKKAAEKNEDNVLANFKLYQLYLEKGDTLNAKKSLDLVMKYNPEILK